MSFLKFPVLLLLVFFMFNAQAQNSTISNPKMDPDKSIIKNAKASGKHDLLLAAVRASDLEKTLDNDGPFTVFAPNDLDFDITTKEKVKELLEKKDKKELQSVLGYHIIAGKITASKILKALCRGKGKAKFTTISGEILNATMKGLDIILTDEQGHQSTIIKADADQCNGIIHEIDSIKPFKA
ncbi:fasciclin domain-containing protein [Cellulophaga sp. HaHaR_3_176]|uniref:fasciclin domain-containing protein n=1 Tax=Cellulophaga sp. HaHaR_3_176 TaxID=1942464 RepID=UPI001C1FBB3E|nr:fasciclin domain-containing protein [Cellulophaga sp. HaHaR_3_176]QWX85494.1 fasciclin domain-containing protein [Cellulophaga sp. HaHaR_3_176]